MNLNPILAFLLTAHFSCGENSTKFKFNPEAIELNNKAMTLVPFIDNPDSSNKALTFLDQATNIDSNYYLGYSNKLMFYYQLKQFDKVAMTLNKLIQLRPTAHDLYMMSGILYEQMGDSISSINYFQKSLTICNNVLDTMNLRNRDYEMLSMNKAINLIMLGDEVQGNQLLKQLYDSETDSALKELSKSLMNKTKKELLDSMAENKYNR